MILQLEAVQLQNSVSRRFKAVLLHVNSLPGKQLKKKKKETFGSQINFSAHIFFNLLAPLLHQAAQSGRPLSSFLYDGKTHLTFSQLHRRFACIMSKESNTSPGLLPQVQNKRMQPYSSQILLLFSQFI